jgi:hypothetical protein
VNILTPKKLLKLAPGCNSSYQRLIQMRGKSAATFCCQVAAWVLDMFCYFYLMKDHKIAKNLTTTRARENMSTGLESSEF